MISAASMSWPDVSARHPVIATRLASAARYATTPPALPSDISAPPPTGLLSPTRPRPTCSTFQSRSRRFYILISDLTITQCAGSLPVGGLSGPAAGVPGDCDRVAEAGGHQISGEDLGGESGSHHPAIPQQQRMRRGHRQLL